MSFADVDIIGVFNELRVRGSPFVENKETRATVHDLVKGDKGLVEPALRSESGYDSLPKAMIQS